MTGGGAGQERPDELNEHQDQAREDRPVAPVSADGFRLGGEMPMVMRLSRKALATIGVTVSFAIGGALIYALQPQTHLPPENLVDTQNGNRAEQITGAPADYGQVPKLGPPLPGDLGRPILTAQADGKFVPLPQIEAGAGEPTPDPAIAAAEQAAQVAAQEKDNARKSRLFLDVETTANETLAAPAPLPATAAPATSPAFLDLRSSRSTTASGRIERPVFSNVLQAGTVIAAALITGIQSDLPGQITAQVTQNVYDSPTGRTLLIPQGSRLIGEYDSEVTAGQSRVLLAWDRIILPGGNSIRLDRFPGADASGKAGLSDRTDYHWGKMLKAALVSTLLGAGTEVITNDQSDIARALRFGTQDTVSRTGRQLVERQLKIPPTLTIRPGFALRIIVTRDLIFEPAGGTR
jgi:type IV secretion system protein TrbI